LHLPAAWAHDIPNQRVDRAIQISVTPGRLEIDYEVSLTELTLTQDLRALVGNLPGGERADWLARYAQVTGPLDAKGILVSVGGRSVVPEVRGYDLVVEEHPRYTFHFAVPIPEAARVSVQDTNYASSEGTSRLAVRGIGGMVLSAGETPADVNEIPIRPLWLLSDAEERRTKQVEFTFRIADAAGQIAREGSVPRRATMSPQPPARGAAAVRSQAATRSRLSHLLGEQTRLPWFILGAVALGLGAAHALQPGHGKTLVTAVALGPDARFYQPALLGLATTLAHAGSVLLIATALWYTGATRVEALDGGLTHVAGFLIAAAGFWRLGRHFGGHGAHADEVARTQPQSNLAILGLGLAGGLVPCWDAVALLLLAAALGRLGEGVGLVLSFSAGMAAILVMVGVLAWKLKARVVGLSPASRWQYRFGVAGSLILAIIGLVLFLD
jgi:ABC-type nickel/cobalt efflux system permease component RcnA